MPDYKAIEAQKMTAQEREQEAMKAYRQLTDLAELNQQLMLAHMDDAIKYLGEVVTRLEKCRVHIREFREHFE